MQSVSSRIWPRVAVSISYDDNNYTTGTSIYIYIYDYLKLECSTMVREIGVQSQVESYFCILNLGRAANQRHIYVYKQKITWSIGSYRRYEIIYADACLWIGAVRVWVRASLQSRRSLHWEQRPSVAHGAPMPSVEHPQPRSRRSVKWGLENSTACNDQEKKLWVSIAICLNLS